MIIALFVTVTALALILWLTTMYIWWRQVSGVSQTSANASVSLYMSVCSRLARRGWYACTMYARSIGTWGNKKMQRVFFALFPGAEPAFAKRDALAGLKHGPSSYFLRSISEKETAPKKGISKDLLGCK